MSRRQWMIAGLILLLVLVASVIATQAVFTSRSPGMNDFMSRWEGARSFWQDGLSPYSEQASLNIQTRIYGRAAQGSEDPGFFVYPFYTVFVVGPTVPFSYDWASAIWMVVLQFCLIAALVLQLSLLRWKPAPIMLGALLLWALLDYFAARGLVLGQPSHLVYLLQMGVIWAIFRERLDLAGAALALSTFKPQMGYLFVPVLLLWALWTRRYDLLRAFGVMFGLLLLASFLLQPDWFGDWIDQVRLYPDYTSVAYPDTGSPVWIITQHYLGLGSVAEWLLNGLLLLPLVWAWWSVLVRGHEERFLWALALTLVITHLVALRTATPHFVVLNLIILLHLKRLSRLRGSLMAIFVLALLFAFSWGQFLLTVQGRATLEHPSLFLPLPFALLGLLLWRRHLWWSEFAPQLNTDPGEERS